MSSSCAIRALRSIVSASLGDLKFWWYGLCLLSLSEVFSAKTQGFSDFAGERRDVRLYCDPFEGAEVLPVWADAKSDKEAPTDCFGALTGDMGPAKCDLVSCCRDN